MKIGLLGWLLIAVLLLSVTGMCPPNNSTHTAMNCTDNNDCGNDQLCCPVGCSQLCVDDAGGCANISCQNITCSAPRLTVLLEGDCCKCCVEANELCPTTVASVGDEDCPMNCTSDDQCADDEICCGNGCGQMCVTRCPQLTDCPSINCTPPSIPIEGECCPSCAVSTCTIQCNGSPYIFCENGTVNDTFSSSSCGQLIECFHSNITDALQCVEGISDSLASTITSLIINQPADEVLQTETFANIDLPSLLSLSIINGGLKYIEDDAFNATSLMDLTQLNLSGNSLTELAYLNFRGLNDLNKLDVGNNRIQQLNEDLRPLFISLQAVNLAGNNFTCDCCLVWLVECEYSAVTLAAEYCSNSHELPSNRSIAELMAEEVCPSCCNDTFRYEGSCSRQCTPNMRRNCSTNNLYDLAIGAAAGIIVTAIIVGIVCLCCSCCKKRRNVKNTNHEMFKLGDASGSFGDISREETFGFRSRLMQRFTRKQVRFDDTENIIGISKAKSKKKVKKEPVWFHDNIYEMDEVDSKFEAFYSQEIMFEELSPYLTQLSFHWYELGQRLGLDSAKLDTIKFAIGTAEGRCHRMLKLWLNPEDSPRPTWETFFTALKGGQSNTEYQVADDIYNPRSVKTVMEIIFLPAKNKEEDEIVWQAWNFLLSKAEGSVSYCKAFLKVNGLDLLLHCNQLFTSDVQLKGVFFYILDAIAQYPELQSYLMRSDVMYACKGMLASKYYPVISFTAGSVIVRMAINGNEVWGYLIPDREEMLNSLAKTIPKWNIEHKMQDNFARGLQKLDYLIQAATNEDNRISHWGIWALANHCITNGFTYCVQLRRTGQLARVEQLMQDAKTSQIRQLCTQVVNCCEEHKET